MVTSVLHTDTLTIVTGELSIISEVHAATEYKGETLVTSGKFQLCPVFLQSLAFFFVAPLVVVLDRPVVFSQDIAVLNG